LREWVDSPNSTPDEFDAMTSVDEQSWIEERRQYLLY